MPLFFKIGLVLIKRNVTLHIVYYNVLRYLWTIPSAAKGNRLKLQGESMFYVAVPEISLEMTHLQYQILPVQFTSNFLLSILTHDFFLACLSVLLQNQVLHDCELSLFLKQLSFGFPDWAFGLTIEGMLEFVLLERQVKYNRLQLTVFSKMICLWFSPYTWLWINFKMLWPRYEGHWGVGQEASSSWF